MADLRVTDAIVSDAQHGFQAAANRLEPIGQALIRLDADPAGAAALTSALASQDGQLAAVLATTMQCLTWLAQNTSQAGQQFGDTDQALSRAVDGG
jgi:hypothetical protein